MIDVVARTARHDETARAATVAAEALATFDSEGSRHMKGSAAERPSEYLDASGLTASVGAFAAQAMPSDFAGYDNQESPAGSSVPLNETSDPDALELDSYQSQIAGIASAEVRQALPRFHSVLASLVAHAVASNSHPDISHDAYEFD